NQSAGAVTVNIDARGAQGREGVQNGECAGWRDLKKDAGAIVRIGVGAIEVTICTLNQADRGAAPIGIVIERVQGRESAARRDLEVGAVTVGPATGSGSIEVTVRALNQTGERPDPIGIADPTI